MANLTLSDIIQGGKAYIANNISKVVKKEVFGMGKCEATYGSLFKAYLITDALSRPNTYTGPQQDCLQSELLNQIMTPSNLQGIPGINQNPFDAGTPQEPGLAPPPHPGTASSTPSDGIVVDIGAPAPPIPMFCSVRRGDYVCSGEESLGQVTHLTTVSGGTAPYTYLWSCSANTSLPVAQQGLCSLLNLINPTNPIMVTTGIAFEKGYTFTVVITDSKGATCTKTIDYDDKSCHSGLYG